MGAVLNRSVAKDGVIAYQDSLEVNKFHYLPARIDAILGETLDQFKVTYFGINKSPYYMDMGDNLQESVVGGVVSGKAIPDITEDQKVAITKEIGEQYKVDKPNLTPLELSQVTVQPIFSRTIAEMGQSSNADFPATVKFGSSFNYNITSGNSLFAEMCGAAIDGSVATENPDVGINITGLAEFYGDPWKAKIECDLSKVWEYTRTKVNAGLSLGWLQIGTQIDKITQSLISEGIVNIEYIEGSGGDEFGRQMLETTKTLFEAINAQVASGEGFFRFEPNPSPQELPDKEDPWGAKLLPWTASLNVGYGSNSFSQSIKYENTVSFTGKIRVPIATSMNLAVPCAGSSQQYFYDLQMKQIGCITAAKSSALQGRLAKEANAKNSELLELYEDVKAGKITTKQYSEMKALLNTLSFTEDSFLSESEARSRFSNLRKILQKSGRAVLTTA
jgi:hypothetical protein